MTATTCPSTARENMLFRMEKFAQSHYPAIAKPLAKIMTDLFISAHFLTACEGWGPTPCGARIGDAYEMYQKDFEAMGVINYKVMMAIAEKFYRNVDFPGKSGWKGDS